MKSKNPTNNVHSNWSIFHNYSLYMFNQKFQFFYQWNCWITICNSMTYVSTYGQGIQGVRASLEPPHQHQWERPYIAWCNQRHSGAALVPHKDQQALWDGKSEWTERCQVGKNNREREKERVRERERKQERNKEQRREGDREINKERGR